MDFLIRFLSRISSRFKWDILYRIIAGLPVKDRRTLVFRLLQEDADQITFERDNTSWTGYTWDESTSWSLFVDGPDAGREIQSLIPWMKSQSRFESGRNIIIEAGANIGITTIPLAQQSECVIAAIEPNPENFSLLQQNIKQNGLEDRVICIQKAVLNKKGPAVMGLQSGASGGAEIQGQNAQFGIEAKGHLVQDRIEVQGDTVMSILADQNIAPHQVAFVWSDIQGSEPDLIQHGDPLWAAGVPLFLEIEPVLLRQRSSIADLITMVESKFHAFIEIQNLIDQGTQAIQIPISRIGMVFDQHDNDHSHTEVLLIPIEP